MITYVDFTTTVHSHVRFGRWAHMRINSPRGYYAERTGYPDLRHTYVECFQAFANDEMEDESCNGLYG